MGLAVVSQSYLSRDCYVYILLADYLIRLYCPRSFLLKQ